MAAAIAELVRYGSSFLPEAEFTSYVPPSNYLSAEGQRVLLETVPQMRTLSGLYLNEVGVNALVQEFREEADGSTSVPRISSGFSPDEYNQYVIAHELALHGVFSHFIHPDDVLDPERGALIGWQGMFESFTQMLSNIESVYAPLRYSTASEGAAAVQRYDRATVVRTWNQDRTQLTLTLSPFYDELWLALRARDVPASVTGGELFAIADGLYWVRADQATVTMEWEAGQ
jgi:hypothetical protein